MAHKRLSLLLVAILLASVSVFASAQDSSPATITIVLPEDANLYFDGKPTQQVGGTRTFTTPPLAPGSRYSYDVKVEAVRDGKAVIQTKKLSFRAGETVREDFSNIGKESAAPAEQAQAAPSSGAAWPRKLSIDGSAITFYQPQVEKFDGNHFEARAAVSIETKASAQPTFGVMWMSARAAVDKETRQVTLDEFQVPRATFPSAPNRTDEYLEILRKNGISGTRVLSLDAIQANLAVTGAEAKTRTVVVKNDPPRIFFSTKPALLLLIDGQPVLRQIQGSPLLRVINSRHLILLDQTTGKYYFHLIERWLEAPKVEGPWSVARNPPSALASGLQAFSNDPRVDLCRDVAADVKQELENGALPIIYASTTPAELVETDGEPELVPVEGTKLLWAKNSISPILLDTADQNYYVLLSGRWFRSTSLNGPWEFVPSDKLPADFAKVPQTHPAGDLLASVAGTPQAQEAVIASQVPQTATIKRSEAKLEPIYDGAPQFAAIDNTPLQYAVNSPTPVVQVDPNSYYAVENGVWFTAGAATGPWQAATAVPPVIYTIPPSSPIYYATQAYVYGFTPDLVYVGYTPGYFGSCICPQGVVVYGTGWPYSPWIGATWIGRPWSYGWNVNFGWTPGGWGFGFAAAFGRPWWGPVGWHAGWGGDWWHKGWRGGFGGRYANAHINHLNFANVNIYNRWSEQAHIRTYAEGMAGHAGLNNVMAGRDGNVFRRGANGAWEQHAAAGWQAYHSPAAPVRTPQGAATVNRLNNEWAARRAGAVNANAYHAATGHYTAPMAPAYRPVQPYGGGGFHGAAGGFRSFGGGYHGGGGGRRR